MATNAAPKKTTPKNQKSFEQNLWDTADKLRGSVESSEYKHVILSLIFLKFISDKFEARKQALMDEGQAAYVDMVEFYTMKNVFYLPEDSRWSYIQKHAKQDDIAVKIDTALHDVEKNNKSLRGALPDNYFSRLGLDSSKLAALIDSINNIDTVTDKEEDVVGRVYEYFLGKFAATEGKGGGEFYTPKCVVNLIAEMIEPYQGKIYDPCCGSGGMFVQSVKFVENHQGNQKDISIYGQEQTGTTYKLAKMNLAIRGIAGNLGEVPADTFFKDQHPDLKADFIMANPPFNLKEWRASNELTHDPRWAGYEVPPAGNANYGWILHMISKLSANGVAGFVLANGSMATNTSGEGAIRQKMIENDLVDCMIALPGQLFYTTQIPVCLWFLTKNKKAQTVTGHSDSNSNHRDRQGETLFIDARNIGTMIDRTHKELTNDDIAHIARTYHTWRNTAPVGVDLCVCPNTTDPQPVGADLCVCPNTADPQSVGADLCVCPNTADPQSVGADLCVCPNTTDPQPVGADLCVCPNTADPQSVGADLCVCPDTADPQSVGADLCVCPDSGTGANTEERANTQVRPYGDIPGFCKSVTLADIKAKDYVLTPGRYVGAAEIEDDGVPFEQRMTELTQTLYRQMAESEQLDAVIKENLAGLGYGE